MPGNNKFLNAEGLSKYHTGVVTALKEKTNKPFIGDREPTSSDIRIEGGASIWFDTSESDTGEEIQNVNLMSLDEEELTFNDEGKDEELTFNDEGKDEELTFNDEEIEEELTFNNEEE